MLAIDVHPGLHELQPGHEVRCWLYHDEAGVLRPEADRLRPVLTAPARAPVSIRTCSGIMAEAFVMAATSEAVARRPAIRFMAGLCDHKDTETLI